MPVELASPTRFEEDTEHHGYDRGYVERWWRIVGQVHQVFTECRCAFIGKRSPVHFFRGASETSLIAGHARRKGLSVATIIGLCGSLRRASFNLMLLHAAVETVPPGTSIEVESIREIPLYDGDVEAETGIPPAVQRLKDRIAGADGVLIVTPEYNNSIPGVLKNAIDWLSRPASDIGRVFRGRPVAVMGATPGPGGTALSQAAWLPVLRTLGMRPWFEGRVLISGASKMFDTNGRVVDTATQDRIRTFMEGFAAFVDAQRRPVP